MDASRIWEGYVSCAAGYGAACDGAADSEKSIVYLLADNAAGPWSEAVIADLNLDGIADIVGATACDLGLDYYQGALTAGDKVNAPLSAFGIPTRGIAAFLSVGNFDGDLVPDVAFGEINSKVPDQGDALAVLFGRPLEPPNTIVEMGQINTIKQLTSANFAHYTFSDDPLSDLVAVTVKTVEDPMEAPHIDEGLLFRDPANRQLQSPVRLGGREPDPTQAMKLSLCPMPF